RGEGTGRREGDSKTTHHARDHLFLPHLRETELSRSSCRFVRNWVLAHSVS
ncbi:unnamed protein product, partial [Ectocarpus sp. 6 AP-2014]